MTVINFNQAYFEKLFEECFDDLMAFVHGYLRDKEAARDVVHDAFFTLWKNRKTMDVARSPRAYLYKMARNGALNYLRHQRVVARNESALAYNAEITEREVERYEQALARLTALASQLPEQQRRVVELCFVETKDYKEIALAMGISVNTVKTHLQRAMKLLRDGMREDLFLLILLRGTFTLEMEH